MVFSDIGKRFSKILVFGVAFMLVCGCSNKKDLSGTWRGQMTLAETGKSLKDLELNLQQKGSELNGTMSFTKVEGGKMKLAGKREDDSINFTTEYKAGLSMKFDGKVTSGSKIKGTAVLYYNDPKVPVKQDTVTMELVRK